MPDSKQLEPRDLEPGDMVLITGPSQSGDRRYIDCVRTVLHVNERGVVRLRVNRGEYRSFSRKNLTFYWEQK